MPCPYFAPHLPTSHAESAGGRFPLIDSFLGDCHATATPSPAPPEMLGRYCNHGYSGTDCTHFPAADSRSAVRYSVVHHSAEFLDILIIVEYGYAPVTWQPVRYFIDSGVLDPACADACTEAQALAFSKAYLRRFPTDWR